MVEASRLKEGQVEFVREQPVRDVLRERWMTLERRERPRPAAFVSDGERLREPEREAE